jgi:uncharacterized protein
VKRPEEYLSVEEAQTLYDIGDAAHDFDHVMRVSEMAARIAQAEGANVTVVRLAALLHDLPVMDESRSSRGAHHLAAAETARGMLLARGLGTEETENVVHCIEAHRFRDTTIQPQTLEAQCVYDADKLDSMGAIGIGRAFAYAGAHRSRLWTTPVDGMPDVNERPHGVNYTPVHEYAYKLRLLLNNLHTETARRIGEGRHMVMVAFFAQLDAEMMGDA